MIFVDTVAWLSLFDDQEKGPQQRKSRQFASRIEEALCTSDLVIAETHKWLVHHGRPPARAQQILSKLINQELTVILPIEQEDREIAAALVRKYSDQKLSYADAVTVAIATRCGISKVFSFDRHFLLFPGIQRVPE